MKAGGGKQKGSAFEREVCKRLSLWVTSGKHTDVFWRSAMSGGRATVQHRKGVSVRQTGDITAVAPEGHELTNTFFIECKHVRDLAIASFIVKNVGGLAKFWETVCVEATKHDREPMLIARQNNMPTIVLWKYKTTRDTHLDHIASCQHGNCIIMLWDDLLAEDYQTAKTVLL